jgi:hypothetical protein
MDSGNFQDDRGRSYEFKRNDLVRRRIKGGKTTGEFRWKRPSAVIVDERTVEIDSEWFKQPDREPDVVKQVRGKVPYGITGGSTLTWYSDPREMAVIRDPQGRVVGGLVSTDHSAADPEAHVVTVWEDMTRQQWLITIGVCLAVGVPVMALSLWYMLS